MIIKLELIKVWFIHGDSSEFWTPKGMRSNLAQDYKFFEAYGEVYNPVTNEIDVNQAREFVIRMDSISFIEFKNKFKEIDVK